MCLFLLTVSLMVLAANPVKVTGRVTDTTGELMIGVTIQEKGTSYGTISDMNGTYNITQTTKDPILVDSYIGYQTQEKKVNGTVLDITLQDDVTTLDEVQVVGYGTMRKVSVVGAQSTLKMEHIKAPVANMSSILAGRISGLVAVQRTGVPGQDDYDIWIRGISSMTNTN